MAEENENGMVRALARARRRFGPVWSGALVEYEQAEGLEQQRELRAWWSKQDIIALCEWPVEVFGWKALRRELYRAYGLVQRSRGIPRSEEDRARVRHCWTIPTSASDRTRLVRADIRRQATNLENARFYLEEGAKQDALHRIDGDAMDDLREALEDSDIDLGRLLQANAEITGRALTTDVLDLLEEAGE